MFPIVLSLPTASLFGKGEEDGVSTTRQVPDKTGSGEDETEPKCEARIQSRLWMKKTDTCQLISFSDDSNDDNSYCLHHHHHHHQSLLHTYIQNREQTVNLRVYIITKSVIVRSSLIVDSLKQKCSRTVCQDQSKHLEMKTSRWLSLERRHPIVVRGFSFMDSYINIDYTQKRTHVVDVNSLFLARWDRTEYPFGFRLLPKFQRLILLKKYHSFDKPEISNGEN